MGGDVDPGPSRGARTMVSLAVPFALLLLPVPFLVAWLLPPHRDRRPALRFPFFHRLAEAAGTEPRAGAVILSRSRVQLAAAALCWVLIVLALARPERLGEPVEIETSARDVMLAIDISGSMDTRDFQSAEASGAPVQRLEAVRNVVAAFIAGRDGDRIGLIVFGTKAYLQAPLTDDLSTILGFLDGTEVGMAGPHTAIGDAIGLAIHSFDTSDVDERLLILLSDGADTASRMDPVNAAAIAAGKGVEIYTIGVGDPEASGEDRVDLDALQDIAKRTGGAYFFAADQEALSQVYARIDDLTPRVTDTQTYRPRTDLAWIAMVAAAVLGAGVLGWLHLVPGRRRARP